MAFRSQITSAVESAFTTLGDLVVNVTFSQSSSSNYDFANQEAVVTTVDPVTVEGILFADRKSSVDGNQVTNNLIVRAAQVPDVDIYDAFTVGGSTYKLTNYVNNGFTIEISLSGA